MATTERPRSGLFRTTRPMPGLEADFPADVLVYVGADRNTGERFVVRPRTNRNNRWYWSDPTTPLTSWDWERSLMPLPQEGFYTLPETLALSGGGKWLENAVVQLGYNERGRGILFVAERHDYREDNALLFSERGIPVDDALLERLRWAPILPVSAPNVH